MDLTGCRILFFLSFMLPFFAPVWILFFEKGGCISQLPVHGALRWMSRCLAQGYIPVSCHPGQLEGQLVGM